MEEIESAICLASWRCILERRYYIDQVRDGCTSKDQGVTIPKLPTSPFSSRTTLLIKRVRSISNPFDRIGFTDQSLGENSANCSCTPDTIARDKAFDGGAKSQMTTLLIMRVQCKSNPSDHIGLTDRAYAIILLMLVVLMIQLQKTKPCGSWRKAI